jgi:hypothetical protein
MSVYVNTHESLQLSIPVDIMIYDKCSSDIYQDEIQDLSDNNTWIIDGTYDYVYDIRVIIQDERYDKWKNEFIQVFSIILNGYNGVVNLCLSYAEYNPFIELRIDKYPDVILYKGIHYPYILSKWSSYWIPLYIRCVIDEYPIKEVSYILKLTYKGVMMRNRVLFKNNIINANITFINSLPLIL